MHSMKNAREDGSRNQCSEEFLAMLPEFLGRILIFDDTVNVQQSPF